MATSKCIYCDSTSYGKPCLFSPTNTHAHMSDPNKCIYCGSKNKGAGCVYNPYGKFHVAAPDFLNRSVIKTEKAALLDYFLDKAYSPDILGENYKSPLDRFYKRLKDFILNSSLPLIESLILSETRVFSYQSREQLIESVDLKNSFKKTLKELRYQIQEASKTLPPELVEESLLNAILSQDED